MSEITITDQGAVGMVTLRADLADPATTAALSDLTGLAVPGQREILHSGDISVAWMSPDELLIILPHDQAEAAAGTLSASLKDTHHLAVNVSDARAVFRIEGPAALEIIAKGAPIDIDSVTQGQIRRTRLGQVAMAFWLVDEKTVDLVCFRSVGAFVKDWLETVAVDGAGVEYLARH